MRPPWRRPSVGYWTTPLWPRQWAARPPIGSGRCTGSTPRSNGTIASIGNCPGQVVDGWRMLRLIFVFAIIAVGTVYLTQGPFYALLFYLWNAYFRPEYWV